MSTITYAGISEYGPRTAAQVNTMLTAFVTRSTQLDSSTFRDEGLNESAIVAEAVSADSDGEKYAGVDEEFANTLYAVIEFTVPATTFRVDNGGLGWALSATEGLRVRFGTEFYLANGTVKPYYSEELSFVVVFRRGGVTTQVAFSEQTYQGNRFIFTIFPIVAGDDGIIMEGDAPPSGTAEVDVYRDAAQLTWWIVGNGQTLEWVEIHSKVTGGNYTLAKSSIQAVAFYR